MTPVFQTVRSVLARLLVPYGKPGAPDPRGAVLYTSLSTRRVRALCPDGTDVALSGTSGGGSGDVVGPASSVDSEVALFSGTTGKLLKRASATGIAKLASGVLSAVTTWPNTALTGTAYGLARFDSGGAAETLAPGATGTILTMGASAAQWSAPSATLTGSRVAEEHYGNGRDGAVDADGAASITVDGVSIAPVASVYTLTGRDILATTLTLANGVILAMGGGVPRCLTLVGPGAGTAYIQDNGANASAATAGAAPGAAGSTGRNAGAGATGRGTAGAGAAGSNVTRGIGGAGGAGGTAAGGSPAGGNGGTSTRTAADGSPHAGSGLLMLTPPSPVGAGYNGGGGGGAGGHDGVSGVSGGGGAGGGVISVYAQTLGSNAANITIRANGGDGGNATGSDNGGGGPGGPGFARLVYDYGTSIPTVQANPGAVGTASGAGANGGAGASGSPQTRKLTV